MIGLLRAPPESTSAWRFTREGRLTVAIASVMGDGAVSLTLALLPVAVVGGAVGNRATYLLNLGFLAATLMLYAALNHRRLGQELGPQPVLPLVGGMRGPPSRRRRSCWGGRRGEGRRCGRRAATPPAAARRTAPPPPCPRRRGGSRR